MSVKNDNITTETDEKCPTWCLDSVSTQLYLSAKMRNASEYHVSTYEEAGSFLIASVTSEDARNELKRKKRIAKNETKVGAEQTDERGPSTESPVNEVRAKPVAKPAAEPGAPFRPKPMYFNPYLYATGFVVFSVATAVAVDCGAKGVATLCFGASAYFGCHCRICLHIGYTNEYWYDFGGNEVKVVPE